MRRSHNLKTIALFGSVLALSACAVTGPVDLGMPQNRLDSPEAYGAFGAGRIHGGLRSTHKVNLTSDYGTKLISNSQPGIESVSDLGIGLGLGLLSFIDLDLHDNFGAKGYTQLKVQVLGKNRRESKPGNFSFSLLGAYASNTIDSEKGSGFYNIFTGQYSGGTATYGLQSNYAHLGFVTGYKIDENFLGYGGYTKGWTSYSGSQTLLNGNSGNFFGSIKQDLYSLGLLIASNKEPDPKNTALLKYASPFLQLELDLSHLVAGSASKTQLNGAINVGMIW